MTAQQSEQEILALEQRLTQATQQLDVEMLNRLYADDYLATGAGGALCRKGAIQDELRRGAEQRKALPAGSIISYDKEDLTVASHGDTAITHYRFTVNASILGNEPISNRFRTTNVWMRRAGGWQIIGGHTSKL